MVEVLFQSFTLPNYNKDLIVKISFFCHVTYKLKENLLKNFRVWLTFQKCSNFLILSNEIITFKAYSSIHS